MCPGQERGASHSVERMSCGLRGSLPLLQLGGMRASGKGGGCSRNLFHRGEIHKDEGNEEMIFKGGVVGYLKGMGDAKGLERGESKMGGVVGRLCSSE